MDETVKLIKWEESNGAVRVTHAMLLNGQYDCKRVNWTGILHSR